jgi:hypothetical protein
MVGGHELLLLCENMNWVETGKWSILNGENGHLLFQFDGGPDHFYRYYNHLADPTINQFCLRSRVSHNRLSDDFRRCEAHADTIILQTFSFTPSGSDGGSMSIVRLGIDVILTPWSNYSLAIQPFLRLAVKVESEGNAVASYPLIETKDTHLVRMAEVVLKDLFPSDPVPPALRHCFILQEPGTEIRKPLSSSSSSSLREPLLPAPEARRNSVGGFVDGGRLLLESSTGGRLLVEF